MIAFNPPCADKSPGKAGISGIMMIICQSRKHSQPSFREETKEERQERRTWNLVPDRAAIRIL